MDLQLKVLRALRNARRGHLERVQYLMVLQVVSRTVSVNSALPANGVTKVWNENAHAQLLKHQIHNSFFLSKLLVNLLL